MSIIERLAEQQIIVISLLVTLIPFALAALLVVLRIVRKLVNRLKQARAEKRMARQQETLLANAEYMDDEYDDDMLLSDEEMQYEAVPNLPVAEEETDETVDDDEESGDEDDSEEASSEIMQLLNDVFVDEESLQRYEVLLQDSEEITADELVTMVKYVAELVGIDKSA